MSLLRHGLSLLDRLFPAREAHAHCDIPCGIYDPHTAQLAAQTVLVMVQRIQGLPIPGPTASAAEVQAYSNTVGRLVTVKEEHAQKCKSELLILWSDYFKPPHLQMFPDLHTTFWNAAKLCSKNKQEVNLQAAEELVATCNQIADMFVKSKVG